MRIGIDLGGTKIEILCLDAHSRELIRRRIPSPQGNYQKTLLAIRDLVGACEAELGQSGTVGIGIPGSLSKRTGLVQNANSTWLIGHPFKDDLENALSREIHMANDANCFALSEASDGAAQGAESVFGVILGTGAGAGLIRRGEVICGHNDIAGEWGHNPLPWPKPEELPGEKCYCGLHGCIETFLSGSGLARIYQEIYGDELTAKEIAEKPTSLTSPVYEIYENRLARALASIINLFDPNIIVLGGGLSNIDRWYETVPKLWDQWVFSPECHTQLVKNKHGDSSGVRGAAWLWPQEKI